MSVVDMHRFYRYNEIKMRGNDQETVDLIKVIKFTDLICGRLKPWTYKQERRQSTSALERIRDDEGNTMKPPNASQMMRGSTIGNPLVLTCFICPRYLDREGRIIRRTTAFWCKDCHMPLCNQARIGDDGGRDQSYLEEYQQAEDAMFACNTLHVKKSAVPEAGKIDLYLRRSKRTSLG
jgi:hypothetical protein